MAATDRLRGLPGLPRGIGAVPGLEGVASPDQQVDARLAVVLVLLTALAAGTLRSTGGRFPKLEVA